MCTELNLTPVSSFQISSSPSGTISSPPLSTTVCVHPEGALAKARQNSYMKALSHTKGKEKAIGIPIETKFPSGCLWNRPRLALAIPSEIREPMLTSLRLILNTLDLEHLLGTWLWNKIRNIEFQFHTRSLNWSRTLGFLDWFISF